MQREKKFRPSVRVTGRLCCDDEVNPVFPEGGAHEEVDRKVDGGVQDLFGGEGGTHLEKSSSHVAKCNNAECKVQKVRIS